VFGKRQLKIDSGLGSGYDFRPAMASMPISLNSESRRTITGTDPVNSPKQRTSQRLLMFASIMISLLF
jgi:hypothetical protein